MSDLVHRGHVEAHGYLLPRAARNVVLARWAPGTELYDVPDGLVLLLPRPERRSVLAAPGHPLTRHGQRYSAVPLDRDAAPAASPTLRVARGGVVHDVRLDPTRRLDPASWLSLGELRVEVGRPLRAPPPPPPPVAPPLEVSAAEALGPPVGDPPPEVATIRRDLDRARQGLPPLQSGGDGSLLETVARGAAAAGGALGAATLNVVGRLAGFLSQAVAGSDRPALPGAGGGGGSPHALAPRPLPSGPSLWDRLRGWWRERAWRSSLGHWLGRRHARYFEDLFERFDRGDLDEALRRAIPAGKGNDGDDALQAPPLTPFGRRDALDLFGGARAGGAVGLGDELHERLRQAYRKAVEALVAQGRIKEAAFALSELLDEHEEAVALLADHGLHAEAARLAETRDLDAGLIVRLWLEAGQTDRAVAIARREGAFLDAIARLQHAPELQKSLRLLWADGLASAGDYGAAVTALGDMPGVDGLADAWLVRAIDIGGAVGARALVQRARRNPAAFEATRRVALDLMEDDGPDEAPTREALGRELLARRDDREPMTAGLRVLYRAATRALLRDRDAGWNALQRSRLLQLAERSQDGALKGDLPKLPAEEALPRLQHAVEVRHLVIARHDRGTGPIHDVVPLPRGRLLVARGEAGVFLIHRDGRTIHHFDVPCDRLVPADGADRALAVKRRDDALQVQRIHLPTRRTQPFTELRNAPHARTFDGSVWYVTVGDRVHALDVLGPGAPSLWCSGQIAGEIVEVKRHQQWMAVAASSGEVWEHATAPHRLSARRQLDGFPVLTPLRVDAVLTVDADHGVHIARKDGPSQRLADASAAHVDAPAASGDWIAVRRMMPPGPTEAPPEVTLLRRDALTPAAAVALEGATGVGSRLRDGRWLVWDDRGRVIVLATSTGAVMANLRL